MARAEFKIGVKEKHLVTVDWDWTTKRVYVELDGQPVHDEHHYSLGPRKFQLKAGRSEVHRETAAQGLNIGYRITNHRRLVLFRRTAIVPAEEYSGRYENLNGSPAA